MRERTTTIPCMLCARLLEQRADKNGKPYFVCELCGTQFFIRGVAGRERLAELFRNIKTATQGEVQSSAGEDLDALELQQDLSLLQSYIETFCADETVIPLKPFTPENAVPFPEWSADVCARLSRAFILQGTPRGRR